MCGSSALEAVPSLRGCGRGLVRPPTNEDARIPLISKYGDGKSAGDEMIGRRVPAWPVGGSWNSVDTANA